MVANREHVQGIPADELRIAPDGAVSTVLAKYAAFKYKRNTSGKLYYSIGEVAAMFHINASKIRFWEKEFDIIKPHKNQKGTRFFTQQDIDSISLIYHYAEERGMTLKGVRQKIKENREDAENTFQIVQSLKKVRAMLLEIKKNIDE